MCAGISAALGQSVREPLQDGRPDRAALLRLYVQQLPPSGGSWWPVIIRPRLAAPTLRDRKIVHAPTKIAGNRPITIGYDFSTVSWGAGGAGVGRRPCCLNVSAVPRRRSRRGPSSYAASAGVVPQGVRLVSLWDSEYGCAPFVKATHDIAADKLFRLRPNLCLCSATALSRPRSPGPAWASVCCASRSPGGCLPASWNCAIQNWAARLVWRLLHCRRAADQPLVVVRIERLEAAHTARDRACSGWAGTGPNRPRWRPGGTGTCGASPWITGIGSPSRTCTGRCRTWRPQSRPNAGAT